MKYKILLLSVILNIAFATFTLAQQKPLDLTIKAYGGYGLLTPHGDFFTDITSYNTGVYHNIKYGLGSGVHAGAGVLLKLNDVISAGVDLDYLTGSKTAPNNTQGDTVHTTFKSNHSVFSLIPNVSFKLFSKDGYHIYNTIGLVSALKTTYNTSNASSGASTPTSSFASVTTQKYKYGINLGFQDAVGVQFRVAKKISVFGQLTGYYLSSSAKSAEDLSINDFTSNGTTSTSEYIRHTTFKKGATEGITSSIVSSGNSTTVTINEVSFPQPQRIFSIGLNAGIVLDLNK